jgi:hypothetical protein
MPRYTHDFQLIFAVHNDSPSDVTNDELWAVLNDRVAELREYPGSLTSEVSPSIQTIDDEVDA